MKLLRIVLAALLCFSLLLTGCGTDDDSDLSDIPSDSEEIVDDSPLIADDPQISDDPQIAQGSQVPDNPQIAGSQTAEPKEDAQVDTEQQANIEGSSTVRTPTALPGDTTLNHFYVTFPDTSCVHMLDAASRQNINVYEHSSAVVTAVPCDNRAMVSGAVGSISLAMGENRFNTMVTAQNGSSTNYPFVIYVRELPDPPSSDSLLQTLEVYRALEYDPETGEFSGWEQMPFVPSGQFDPYIYAYTANWPSEDPIGRIKIVAVPRNPKASISSAPVKLTSTYPSGVQSHFQSRWQPRT